MDPYAPDPAPPAGRSRVTKAAAVVGVTAGLALGATAIAGAVTTPSAHPAAQSTTDPTTPPATNGAPPVGHPGGHRGPGTKGMEGFGMMGGAVHGEFVVPGRDGGYQTIATQRGSVTAVSPTSITVKSADDYSRTYAVNDTTVVSAGDQGIGDVKTGDEVMVLATVDGANATARSIHDATGVRSRHDQWAPPRPDHRGPGGAGGPGAPNNGAVPSSDGAGPTS